MKFLKSLILIMALIFFVQFNSSCDGGNAQNEDSAGSDSTSTDSSNVEKNNDGKSDKENKEEVKSDLIPVEVTTVKRGLMSDFILLSANLETEKMADIYSRVQGLVDNISAEEGDVVKKGQVLMTLEADEYVLAEEKARLNYLSQKSDFDRLEAMHKQDLLSIEEFEKAKYALWDLK